MRLINTSTFDFIECAPEDYRYAILSHTWIPEADRKRLGDEVKYQDFLDLDKSQFLLPNFAKTASLGLQKILRSCAIARLNNIGYLWVDTCCIDKSDKVERDETINSMFDWYKGAEICYAFLIDVDWSAADNTRRAAFRNSRWFTRGWTLQELLAPGQLTFCDRSWKPFGTKETLRKDILQATKIDEEHLSGNFGNACIATKMSWASKRETSRPEDMAYCLLGILGVTMTIEYSEGRKAFIRLQEILIERIPDESIFAWWKEGIHTHGILASWPSYFEFSQALVVESKKYKPRPPYRLTNQGLEWPFPNTFIDAQNMADWNNVASMFRKNIKITLNCWRKIDSSKDTIEIRLRKSPDGKWRRVDCGTEFLSRSVESSGNRLTGVNVKLIYLATQ
ncbi:MAG: hypothetical protein LQ342_008470 [Letrouitia transgressa]|nr:MAG: hypothetical protein LQ342_008470 [Letrouitia transgressa]